jgi:hypothetical protein
LYCTFVDGRLQMWGLHRHGFPMLLQDALVHTGYGDMPLEYYSQLFDEYGLQRCDIYVNIPSHSVFPDGSPWSAWAIRADMEDAMEKAAHMTLTALCSQNLPPTAGTPSHCTRSRTAPTQSGRLTWMRQAISIRSTTTVVGCTWRAMPTTCSSCNMMPSASLLPSGVVLLAMPRRPQTSTKRSVVWPRRMVSYTRRLETWRVASVTRMRCS